MTGRVPGASSLSVRYIKLKEKFAKMGDLDVSVFTLPPLTLFFSLPRDLQSRCFLVPCFATLSSDVLI